MADESTSGYRLLPHTADVIVEAWGVDELTCAEEAARALIEICVSGEPESGAGQWISETAGAQSDVVRSVLDEVVFALDTSELVPVSARVDRTDDSRVMLSLGLARRDSVRFTGAAPKAIVMMAPEPAGPDGLRRCRFIVDV
jgi:SHS2 domain-containing protein